jgi:hypothetical protein
VIKAVCMTSSVPSASRRGLPPSMPRVRPPGERTRVQAA